MHPACGNCNGDSDYEIQNGEEVLHLCEICAKDVIWDIVVSNFDTRFRSSFFQKDQPIKQKVTVL